MQAGSTRGPGDAISELSVRRGHAMNDAIAFLNRNPAIAAAVAVAIGSTATILGALIFQYGFDIAPCPLCLQQRIPHYAVIPLAPLIVFAQRTNAPRPVVLGGLGLMALAMLIGAGIGVYHAGVEWKWWAGPQDCSGPLTPLGSEDLLKKLQNVNMVRCDEASWRFLGLSLAGYNVLISLALATIAVWGIMASRRQSRDA